MSYYYNPYYSYYYSYPVQIPAPYRLPTFPEVDTHQLVKSAEAFKPLMKDADKIIHTFADSTEFAYNVMDAAQKSQTDKIKQYIKNIGIARPVEINYTPDAIRLELINKTEDIDCCKLNISLHW